MKRNNWYGMSKHYVLITQVGLVVVVNIIVFFLIGLFLDSRFNTGGVLIVIFIILGVAAGFYQVYKLIEKMERNGE